METSYSNLQLKNVHIDANQNLIYNNRKGSPPFRL